MTDINIPALKAAALAATPGPWCCMEQLPKSYDDHGYRLIAPAHRKSGKWEVYGEKEHMCDERGIPQWGEDAAYIALANPATILALIERLERAEAVAEYARSREMPTTEKQVKAAEMFFTAPMMARLEKLEAVAEAASPFASSNAGGLEARLAQALAALEAP